MYLKVHAFHLPRTITLAMIEIPGPETPWGRGGGSGARGGARTWPGWPRPQPRPTLATAAAQAV